MNLHTMTNPKMKLAGGILVALGLFTAACGGNSKDASPKVASPKVASNTAPTTVTTRAAAVEAKKTCTLASKDEAQVAFRKPIVRIEDGGLATETTPGGYSVGTSCKFYDAKDLEIGSVFVVEKFPQYSAAKSGLGQDNPVGGVGDDAFCFPQGSEQSPSVKFYTLKGQYALAFDIEGVNACDAGVIQLGQVAIGRLS